MNVVNGHSHREIHIPWPIKVSPGDEGFTLALQELLRQGCGQGYLTSTQVLSKLPDADKALLELLLDHGIEVTDTPIREVRKSCPGCNTT